MFICLHLDPERPGCLFTAGKLQCVLSIIVYRPHFNGQTVYQSESQSDTRKDHQDRPAQRTGGAEERQSHTKHGCGQVYDRTAEVIQHYRHFPVLQVGWYHQALAAGSGDMQLPALYAAVELYPHQICDPKGAEAVAGHQAKDQMPRLMDNELNQHGGVYADKHQRKGYNLRKKPFFRLARRIHIHQIEYAAGSTKQHVKHVTDPLSLVLCRFLFLLFCHETSIIGSSASPIIPEL